jgi:hypothetical protein
MSKLRIWRVQPISDTGVKAPYVFVETEAGKLEKAEIEARVKGEEACVLSKFDNWHLLITKERVRKDSFGRYWKYHQ